jgi:hypothetical protein
MTLHSIPLNFLKYEENFIFFFISAYNVQVTTVHSEETLVELLVIKL